MQIKNNEQYRRRIIFALFFFCVLVQERIQSDLRVFFSLLSFASFLFAKSMSRDARSDRSDLGALTQSIFNSSFGRTQHAERSDKRARQF